MIVEKTGNDWFDWKAFMINLSSFFQTASCWWLLKLACFGSFVLKKLLWGQNGTRTFFGAIGAFYRLAKVEKVRKTTDWWSRKEKTRSHSGRNQQAPHKDCKYSDSNLPISFKIVLIGSKLTMSILILQVIRRRILKMVLHEWGWMTMELRGDLHFGD